MRRLLAGLVALAAAAAAPAQTPSTPKLVVVISVDRLSTDLFDGYRAQFSGGLGRLANGTVFPNGVEGQADKSVGDLVKQSSPNSLDVAVAGSRPAAAVMSGRDADQSWYWNGRAFVTGLTGKATPASIALTNQAVARLVAQPEPSFELPPACQAKAEDARFQRAAGDYAGFTNSPGLDGATLAVAAHLVQELRLGQHDAPDVLSIGLSGTANVSRAYGPGGQAMCLDLLSLDRDLGAFLQVLDQSHVDYAVVLAGSGAPAVPILFWRAGTAAAAREEGVTTSDIAPTVAAMLGLRIDASGAGHCLADIQGVLCPPK
jgi:hypothetical protein